MERLSVERSVVAASATLEVAQRGALSALAENRELSATLAEVREDMQDLYFLLQQKLDNNYDVIMTLERRVLLQRVDLEHDEKRFATRCETLRSDHAEALAALKDEAAEAREILRKATATCSLGDGESGDRAPDAPLGDGGSGSRTAAATAAAATAAAAGPTPAPVALGGFGGVLSSPSMATTPSLGLAVSSEEHHAAVAPSPVAPVPAVAASHEQVLDCRLFQFAAGDATDRARATSMASEFEQRCEVMARALDAERKTFSRERVRRKERLRVSLETTSRSQLAAEWSAEDGGASGGEALEGRVFDAHQETHLALSGSGKRVAQLVCEREKLGATSRRLRLELALSRETYAQALRRADDATTTIRQLEAADDNEDARHLTKQRDAADFTEDARRLIRQLDEQRSDRSLVSDDHFFGDDQQPGDDDANTDATRSHRSLVRTTTTTGPPEEHHAPTEWGEWNGARASSRARRAEVSRLRGAVARAREDSLKSVHAIKYCHGFGAATVNLVDCIVAALRRLLEDARLDASDDAPALDSEPREPIGGQAWPSWAESLDPGRRYAVLEHLLRRTHRYRVRCHQLSAAANAGTGHREGGAAARDDDAAALARNRLSGFALPAVVPLEQLDLSIAALSPAVRLLRPLVEPPRSSSSTLDEGFSDLSSVTSVATSVDKNQRRSNRLAKPRSKFRPSRSGGSAARTPLLSVPYETIQVIGLHSSSSVPSIASRTPPRWQQR